MENQSDGKEMKSECRESKHKHTRSDAVYFFGFVGAAIYYISTATTFWIGVLGVLKAVIWPVFLVLEALKFLGA